MHPTICVVSRIEIDVPILYRMEVAQFLSNNAGVKVIMIMEKFRLIQLVLIFFGFFICFESCANGAENQVVKENLFQVPTEAAFFDAVDISRPELALVKTAVDASDWDAAKAAWAAHLESRTSPQWFFSPNDQETLISVHQQHFDGLDQYIPQADLVIDRVFTFLGVTIELEKEVEWTPHINEWNHMLNRFGYFIDMGRAYWATGDERYAEEFANLVQQWVSGNPVPDEVIGVWHQHGTSWRTLEAGIRSWNWMEAMQYFMYSNAFDAETKFLMSRSFIEHGRRLLGKQQHYWPGNWQVNECRSLVGLGIMFPEFKEADEWYRTGLKYLVEHMERDVYPDGMHHEVVPSYHTGVLHYYTQVSRLLALNGYTASGLTDRHERMFEALMVISYPDGIYPPIGNTMRTGSRLMGDYLGIGALLYDRGDMRSLAGSGVPEEAFWLFGSAVFEQYEAINPQPADPKSRLLPDARYAVMRTGWETDDKYLLFDASPRLGGHKHADRLQVIVYAGRELLIDPGMYSYDQPGYQSLRTAQNHNTLVIDGNDQSDQHPELLHWHAGEDIDFVAGVLLDYGVRHQRSVLFVRPDYWLVADHLTALEADEEDGEVYDKEREVIRYFHLPLGPSRFDLEARKVSTDFDHGMNIQVIGLDDALLEQGQGNVPVSMTEIAHNDRAAFRITRELPLTLGVALVPYSDTSELPQVGESHVDDKQVFHVELLFTDGTRDIIKIAPTPMLLNQDGHGEAWALVERIDAQGQCTGVFWVD